jgi:hypothetical protein
MSDSKEEQVAKQTGYATEMEAKLGELQAIHY